MVLLKETIAGKEDDILRIPEQLKLWKVPKKN
jgi:hypothetical protein